MTPSAKSNNPNIWKKRTYGLFSFPSDEDKNNFVTDEGHDMKLSDNSHIEIGPETLKDEAFTHSTSVIVKNSTKPTKGCEFNKITKGTTKDNNKCNRKKQCNPTLIKSSSTSAWVMKSTKDRNNTEPALTSSSNFNNQVI